MIWNLILDFFFINSLRECFLMVSIIWIVELSLVLLIEDEVIMNMECELVIIFFDFVFLVRDWDIEWGGGF